MQQDLHIADYALDGRTHVVEAGGELDLYSAPELKARIWNAIDAGKTRLIMDLTEVTFIDSTGLSVLVAAVKRIRPADGTVALVVKDYDIERLLELTGLDGRFQIFRSRDDAVESLERADRDAAAPR